MQRLPRLMAGTASWRLPLAANTAIGLCRGFMLDEVALRRELLGELLTQDPALALWAACRPSTRDLSAAESTSDLAEWLTARGVEALQWADDECGLQPTEDAVRRNQWSEAVTASVSRARFAAEMVGQDSAGPAYLAAMLHNAEFWLASCGPTLDLDGALANRGCLPAWLFQLLQDVRGGGAASFVSLTVATAGGMASGKRPTLLKDAGGASHLAAGQAAASRWQESCGDVAGLLPGLMQRLRRLAQLETDFERTLETEKLAALKELAYGASHEINNPLANISTRAQTLLREETDPERRRKLAVINSQAFRAHEMISDMMLFARPPKLRIEPCDLTALVDGVLGELAADALEQSTEIERVTADEPLMIAADRTHLAVAIKAVCTNSLEALGSGGRVEIFVQPASTDAGEVGCDWAEIQISDTGPGILPEVRRHLFDPFFSGREAGRGLGFGLAKCWRIVSEHGGRIDVASAPGRGTTFTIRLPKDLPQPVRPTG